MYAVSRTTYHSAQRAGRVINIGSGCNKSPFPNLASYTASKGGIEMLTKTAAVELGRHRITVNCVAPGAIEIERTRQEASGYSETWSAVTPLARVGQPLDVAQGVAFFAGVKPSPSRGSNSVGRWRPVRAPTMALRRNLIVL